MLRSSGGVSRQCPAKKIGEKKPPKVSRKWLIYLTFLVALQGFEPRTCGL